MILNQKTLIEGKGEPPKQNQQIRFTVSSRVKGAKDPNFETKHPQRAVIGRNQLNPVLQEMILTMKQGEKKAFAINQNKVSQKLGDVQYNSPDIQMIVQLLEVGGIVADGKHLSLEEKQSKAQALKQQGNDLIKLKKLDDCVAKYLQAYRLVEYQTTPSSLQLKNTLLLNLSLACANNKQYENALSYCQKVLREDPFNLKGLYRKASALRYLGEFQRATSEIEKVLELNPDNKEFQGLLKEVKELQQASKKKEKQMYSKMFGS